MPFNRYSSRRPRRRRTRASAASTIQRGWRKKMRRRAGGLVSRTALNNRRQLRNLKKCIETKMMSSGQITDQNGYTGQYCQDMVVDNVGQDVIGNLPFAADLLGQCAQGTGSDEPIGAWIHLKSITLHYAVQADSSSPQTHFNLLLVHDQDPGLSTDLQQILDIESASPYPQNWTQLAFQNLGNTGKENRYKILWRKTHVLSAESTSRYPSAAASQVPAITQAAQGSVMRPAYQPVMVVHSAKNYPMCVYGTKTFKFPYKINYSQSPNQERPVNQSLKLLAFQTAPIGQNQPRARLDFHTRVRFHDA